MKPAGLLAALLVTSALALAGALGVFGGKLVRPPDQQRRAGWIFVQSPKGVLRQVEISRARITYADDIPVTRRAENPSSDLVPGVEVLVTAEQDGAGEWRAREVEILQVVAARARR